jgi:hypothetical protein
MLRRRGIDVVAFGRSLEDDGDHYLMRAYASLEDLERSESDFYRSEQWRASGRATPSWPASRTTPRW